LTHIVYVGVHAWTVIWCLCNFA